MRFQMNYKILIWKNVEFYKKTEYEIEKNRFIRYYLIRKNVEFYRKYE